jgi:hypothetical protein
VHFMHRINIKRSATVHKMHPTVQQNRSLKYNLTELDLQINHFTKKLH